MLLRVPRLVLRLSSSFSANPPLIIERLTDTQQGIVVFRMNVPKTKNAISRALISQLNEQIEAVGKDSKARVLILTSNVPGAFCSGADLKERKTMPVEEVPTFVNSLRSFADRLSSLPIPSISAIDGVALGGGLEFALATDIRVASKSSKIGLTETRLAILPGAGGTQRLPRLIGQAKAKELVFTARILNGSEAKELGVVNHVVDDGQAYNKALSIAEEILPNGPIAVRLAKVAIDTGSRVDIASGLQLEQQCYAQVVSTKDRLEGLAAFAEKRRPVYKGE